MQNWIGHGPVRRWRTGFLRVWCRCGVEAYPCPTVRRQQAVEAAREWRDDERRTWRENQR